MTRVQTTYELHTDDYRYIIRRWTRPVTGELVTHVRCYCRRTGCTAEVTHESQRIARAMARERVEAIRENRADEPARAPIENVRELMTRIDHDHERYLGTADA